MEELFGHRAVRVVTAMAMLVLMALICLDKHKKTVRNYMNGRVLRHVAKLHFGTVGGKIGMNIMVEHLLVLFGCYLTHYIP